MLRVIDLFAGCGGLTEGFLSDNFEFVAHVEWDRHASEVLKHRLKQVNPNHADDSVIRFDIQRSDELFSGFEDDEKYGSHLGLDHLVNNQPIDIVIGGPPCQAYSIAGRIRDENGMKDDYRNFLFESFVKVLERYKPKAFIFENVVGMLSAAPGGIPIVDRIRKAFDGAGYRTVSDYKQAVFDMSEYGVPQCRRRVIILGLREDSFDDAEIILKKFYSREEKDCMIPQHPIVTVQDVIGDLPELFPLKKTIRYNGRKLSHRGVNNEFTQHESRFHNSRDIETFRMLTEDLRDGTNLYNSIDAIKTLYTERTGKSANVHKYHVIRPDQPGNTIPAHLYKDGLRHIHWDPAQCRTITVREAACIQGFPRDFEFPVSMGAAYKMIGNAVPPSFSKLLSEALFQLLLEPHGSINIKSFESKSMTGIAYGKILGENELGSMTLPGRPVRGTFILIGTKYRHLFPPMSKTIHNDIQLVKILYNEEENAIWCKYDWHNSKFSKPGVGKAWDETRLYLNSLIHPDNLRFEPDDIVIWRTNSESDIIHLSHFKPHELIYEKIVENSQKLRGNHFFVDENILPTISWHQSDSISSIIPEDGQVTEVTKSWMEGGNSEKQLTNELFRQFVRRAYGNRCAITGNVIRVGDLMNIEAAHIWPDSHQGPMMPDNGVAMDRNLHWAFDKGMFTLINKGERCYVEIHPDCMDIEMLREIADSELHLPEGTYACFKPNPRYIEYHRNNIFGLFKTSGSIRRA